MWISVHNLFYETTVPSSDGTGEYVVTYGANQFNDDIRATTGHEDARDWSCTCADFQYRGKRDGRYCKHIQQVLCLSPDRGGPCFWTEGTGAKPIRTVDESNQITVCAPVIGKNGALIPAIEIPDIVNAEAMNIHYFDHNGTPVVVVIARGVRAAIDTIRIPPLLERQVDQVVRDRAGTGTSTPAKKLPFAR